MARTLRTFRGRSAPQRRKRTWARHVAEQQFSSATPVLFDALGTWATEVGANLPGLTVARLVGRLTVTQATAGQAGFLWMGYQVLDRQAQATNHDPSTNQSRHEDWMFWQQVALYAPQDVPVIVPFDIRSMRKIERTGESLFLVVRATTNALQANIVTSTLVLMP